MTCAHFIAESMALRTATHLAHLSSRSYSQHVALGEFYEGLIDLIDKYAEVYMGTKDQVTSWPSTKLPTGSPVNMLEDYLDLIKEETDEDMDSQALLNILAELEELTAGALYKLRFLK